LASNGWPISQAFAPMTRYGVEVQGAEVMLNRPDAVERLARASAMRDDHMPASPQLDDAGRRRWSLAAKLKLDAH
jgi:hypothetical protein